MTTNNHFKQLVRARMDLTGEPYTAAREAVLADSADVALGEPAVSADVHGRHGQAVTFSADGHQVLSGGQDARIAVLDAASGTVRGELLGHDKVVNAVRLRPGDEEVVSVSSDRTVRIWDLADLREIAVLEGHRDAVVALDVAPDGATAVTGGYDGRVLTWDLRERVRRDERRSELRRVAALAFTPGGDLVAESGLGPVVHVRAAGDGRVVAELDTGSPGVVGLAVSPDGGMLATAGYDGVVTLWDCASWEQVRSLSAGDRASAVCFSRNGRLLGVASRGRITIWADTGEDPVAATTLDISGVYGLAFSADGGRLAQTGADGRVRVWALR